MKILSGVLASYLIVTPCLVFQHHDTGSEEDQIAVAHSQDHGHSHDDHHNRLDSESEHGSDEHCCDDLSGTIHTPVKELPTVTAFLVVIPNSEIVVPYVHIEQRTAFSRGGPIYEQAREHAKTIVMLS